MTSENDFQCHFSLTVGKYLMLNQKFAKLMIIYSSVFAKYHIWKSTNSKLVNSRYD